MYDYSYVDKNGMFIFHEDAGPCPWEQPWPQISNFACIYFATCQTPGQPQSTSSSAGSATGRPPAQQSGAGPKNDLVHIATCSVASVVGPLAAAQITNKVAGIGLGGNAGAGLGVVMDASLGIQLVADPKGNVGVSLSGSFSSILIGASAMAGVQGTITNGTNIEDLNGPFAGFDISAGAGPAVDLGIQSGTSRSWQRFVGPISGSATVGVGVGTKAAVLSLGGTNVWRITNCGTH